MTLVGWAQIALVLALVIGFAISLSKFIAGVFLGERNFLTVVLVLVSITGFILYRRSDLHSGLVFPIILMITGTTVAASVGRVLYQIALSVTANNNGFVTMFFLLIPALTALISIPLSW